MATRDAFDVLQTAIQPALRAVESTSNLRLARAKEIYDRTYAEQRREDERRYQEALEARRRSQRKEDENEARVRSLRTTLAGLLPMGSKLDPNLSEEQLAQQISERTRDRQVRFLAEDRKSTMDFELEKARKLTEEQLRTQAELLGIADAKTAPLSQLQKQVGEQKGMQEIDLQAKQLNARLDAARSMPIYKDALRQLALLEADASRLLGESTLPEPIWNPNLSEEDSRAIYNAVADNPQIAAMFAGFPNGKERIAAIRQGDYETAFAGIDQIQREMLGEKLASIREPLEQSLRQNQQIRNFGAVQAYLKKLDDLPQRIAAINRQRESLYAIGRNEGIPIGLALQMEPKDKLIAAHLATAGAGIPSGRTPDVASQFRQMFPPGRAPAGAAAVGGALPEPGQFVQPTEETGSVKGILPFLGELGMQAAGAVASDPMLREGLSTAVGNLNEAADATGDIFYNTYTGLVGGNLRPVQTGGDPIALTRGAMQAGMTPFSLVGRGMEYAEPGIQAGFDATRPIIEAGMTPFRSAGEALAGQRGNIQSFFEPIRRFGERGGTRIRQLLGAE